MLTTAVIVLAALAVLLLAAGTLLVIRHRAVIRATEREAISHLASVAGGAARRIAHPVHRKTVA